MENTTDRNMNHETVNCDYCGTTLSLKVISWGSRHSCYNCYECKKHL
jgi:transposase-like protein